MSKTSARKFYESVSLQTIAFNVVDPDSKEFAKCFHGNQYCKRYRFKDDSIVIVYNGDKNFTWHIAEGDAKQIWAVKGIGYRSEPVFQIAGAMAGVYLNPIKV